MINKQSKFDCYIKASYMGTSIVSATVHMSEMVAAINLNHSAMTILLTLYNAD